MDQSYPDVRAAVDDGRVVWITVLEENASGGLPSQSDVEAWADVFHHQKIVSLQGDEDKSVMRALGTESSPSAFLLDADTMRVITKDITTGPLLGEVQDRL